MLFDWVAEEMAQRYVQFHYGEPWQTIKLFGLFKYTQIKGHLKDGRLINSFNYVPSNVYYWVIPSKKYWEESIKPKVRQILIDVL